MAWQRYRYPPFEGVRRRRVPIGSRFETREWRLKWKLFDAIQPEWEKQVIK
jgi:hypothetical protein